MSRDCSKNIANYLALGVNQFGPIFHGAQCLAFSAIARGDTFGSADNTDNAIFHAIVNGNTVGVELNVDATGGTNKIRLNGRSNNTDARQGRSTTATFATGEIFQCGGLFDIQNDIIDPVLNGVVSNGGAVVFGSATYTNVAPTGSDNFAAYNLPGTGGTAEQFDGLLIDFTVWKDWRPTADQWLSLGRLVDPHRVNRRAIVVRFRMRGNTSPEPDNVGGLVAAITGSVPKGTYHPSLRSIAGG